MKNFTRKDFDKTFPDNDSCLEWLRQHRYPNGIECPSCKTLNNFHKLAKRPVYECVCGFQISPLANTIFHKSSTPLRSWFHAIFLMASTKTGISAKQLERELGVTYKTACRMFTQIRKLMNESVSPLTGSVEIDETYIGGKHKGKRGRGANGKSIVMGMVERDGDAVLEVIPDTMRGTVIPNIVDHVASPDEAKIITDEYHVYKNVTKLGYAHESAQHGAKQYVNGTAHTNTVESLWSTIKRGIDGVNHSVSPTYLQSYLNSYVYRYNHRKDEQPMFLSLLNRI